MVARRRFGVSWAAAEPGYELIAWVGLGRDRNGGGQDGSAHSSGEPTTPSRDTSVDSTSFLIAFSPVRLGPLPHRLTSRAVIADARQYGPAPRDKGIAGHRRHASARLPGTGGRLTHQAVDGFPAAARSAPEASAR